MNEQYSKDHGVCSTTCGCGSKCSCNSGSMHGSKCISWGGILAGALAAVGLSFLLSLFAAAIGLSAFYTTSAGVTTLAVGGYIGLIIGVFAVMFFSGWVAGYLNRKHCCHRNAGALYGFAAWCLALVITVLIAAQTVQFVSNNLYTFSDRKITATVTTRLFSDAGTESRMGNTNVNDNVSDKMLADALFLMFGVFFVGAIASAVGGYCALCRCGSSSCCSKNTCSSSKMNSSNM